MDLAFDKLKSKLEEHGVYCHALMLMGYSAIWIEPEWPYREILEAYADYVNDAPERVHAELCYRLLKAGYCMGPEQYINKLRKEVEADEDGISVKQGSRPSVGGIDT